MARKRSSQVLHIFLNALPIGEIRYKAKTNLSFAYKSDWLDRTASFPISRSLPLREEPYEGEKVFAYFDNLLPDAVSIRQRIAARMRAESDQVFDLLAVVGRDCVGALQFIKDGEKPPVLEGPKGKPISNREIAKKLRNLRSFPLAASEEEDFRLSIAGAQEKTAFLNIDGRWHVPLDATPTTHIFKPQIGELKPGLSFADSVENEWLCAKISQAFGIPTTSCEISEFEEIKVLVVERFDRVWTKDKLIRIPQEDMCQALGVPNFSKYEQDGGPGIKAIMSLLNESKNRDKDRDDFMKAQVVFLLLAAIDGHAKNFSVSWRPSGFEMTPLYDILSAQPMVDRGKFQYEKLKMAMALGTSRHYKIRQVFKRHFLQTAKICRYDQDRLTMIIEETLGQVPEVIKKVSGQLPKGFPQSVADSVFSGMRARLSHFE